MPILTDTILVKRRRWREITRSWSRTSTCFLRSFSVMRLQLRNKRSRSKLFSSRQKIGWKSSRMVLCCLCSCGMQTFSFEFVEIVLVPCSPWKMLKFVDRVSESFACGGTGFESKGCVRCIHFMMLGRTIITSLEVL